MELLSLGIILVAGFLAGLVFEKIKLPKIIGMIIIGILIGPSLLNIIDESILNISHTLRQIALVIILTRTGLSLDLKTLKAIGRPAVFLSFIPAILEIIGVLILGPILLKISITEALLLGSVLAAVSPAVIIPRMLKLKEAGYGTNKRIPELVLAGSSIDDIFVIILFYAFLGIQEGVKITASTIIEIPIAIILGIIIGVLVGLLIGYIIKLINNKNTTVVVILIATSFILIGLEQLISPVLSFSALLSIITMGIVLLYKDSSKAKELEKSYNKLWFVFEILLFVLVGISVDINFAISAGYMPVILILSALIFRVFGVYLALLFTNLTYKEKLFITISYIPKATVQASIGGIALAMGLSIGPLILSTAVLSILITAPLGAILIDNSYPHLLVKT